MDNKEKFEEFIDFLKKTNSKNIEYHCIDYYLSEKLYRDKNEVHILKFIKEYLYSKCYKCENEYYPEKLYSWNKHSYCTECYYKIFLFKRKY